MDNSTAKDQINTSDLIEVLRELRDSVRNQTTLLEELLTEHRASRETPKRSHKSSQRSSQSPSSNSNHNGDKGGDASCENNQTTQPVTAELDDRGALARQLSPLLHDRVAFWKVEKELATYLSKTYRYTPPTSLSFIDNMTSTKAQPHRGVAGNNWKYCKLERKRRCMWEANTRSARDAVLHISCWTCSEILSPRRPSRLRVSLGTT